MTAHRYTRAIAFCTLLLFSRQPVQADWVTPYAADSITDQILRYVGVEETVTAPNAGTPLAGFSYNNTEASGSGAGANLGVKGATTVGVGGTFIARANAQVTVGGDTPGLYFNTVTAGVPGQLVGASLTMIWSGTSEVVGSDTWDSFGSTSYRYVFNLTLSAKLLVAAGQSLLDSVTLEITAGENTLYSATGLTTILGEASVADTSYSNVAVEFEYDQSQGALSIEWKISPTVTGDLLATLDVGTNHLFGIGGASIQVDAIPEPASLSILLGGGALCMLRFRRRRA